MTERAVKMSDSGLRVANDGVITIAPAFWRTRLVYLLAGAAFGFPAFGTFIANISSESVSDVSAAANIENVTNQVATLNETVKELAVTQSRHMYEAGHPGGMAMMSELVKDVNSVQAEVNDMQEKLNQIIGKLEAAP